jgi:predicted HAD superfamily Cof-like phosphohydrolase
MYNTLSAVTKGDKMLKNVKEFIDKFEFGVLDSPGFHPALDKRVEHIDEELTELKQAIKNGNKEETIDALLDIVYIALGTAYMCGFDTQAHWDEIQRANMSKVRGVTKRGHSYDVKKTDGWQGPDHTTILEN